MKLLNTQGQLILLDYLINNHIHGLEIVHSTVWFKEYISLAQEYNGEIRLAPEELSSGGCYLLDVNNFLEDF